MLQDELVESLNNEKKINVKKGLKTILTLNIKVLKSVALIH